MPKKKSTKKSDEKLEKPADDPKPLPEIYEDQKNLNDPILRKYIVDPSYSTTDNLIMFILNSEDEKTKKEAERLLDKIIMGDKPIEYNLGIIFRNLKPLLVYSPFLVGIGILAALINPDASGVLSKVFSFLSSLVWIGFLVFIANKIFKFVENSQLNPNN